MNQRKKVSEERHNGAADESLSRGKSRRGNAAKISSLPPVIAGIGASAGGLEAIQRLLSRLSDARNLALVFLQHLDPSAKTLLPDLIAKSTALKVVEIKGRRKLQPGTLYICPPKALLALRNGIIRIIKAPAKEPQAAIDHLFYAIAEDQGERGIGVILSGAGSDGTLGLKAISDHGGLTLAQDVGSAQHDAMPRSAATTGVADFVLPPEDIALEIQNYARHLQELREAITPEQTHELIREAIPAIAARLMELTNHNFQHYKTNTLIRRIQRRMQVLKVVSVEKYVDYLRHHNDEVWALFRELLIGVTHFFRDPESFDTLKKEVLIRLCKQRLPDDRVRIWIAGCANGAEAYTIAILCREVMDSIGSTCKVQIFATDIDERALQVARAGIYPIGIAEHLSSDRLRKFFDKRGKQYIVKKEIREFVLFSNHNLISDPPFSRLDLIVCRNLLIYLGSHLQNKLIPLFHYALRPGGYLFLGPSESITAHGDLFSAVSAQQRISQRKDTSISNAPGISNARVISSQQPAALQRVAAGSEPDAKTDLTAMAQRIVLDEFAPRYAVTDDSGRILNTSPNVGKYIRIGGGDYHNDIVKLTARGLQLGLRSALAEAKKKRRRVDHEHLSMKVGNKIQRVMLTVQPMPRLGEDEPLLLIVFHDVGLPITPAEADAIVPSAGSNADALVAQMELELETARHDLDKSLQDMEAANEELKSSNEELLSMNEELQSANEELETSKEEIRLSSAAVAEANADLENLLRSTQIATVFLDELLRIRSFTPALCDIYELVASDIGRPLEKFVPAVTNMPPLPDPKLLHDKATAVEHTVLAHSGKSYIRRVLPYRSHTGEANGAVVTFIDVTELRASEDMVSRALSAGRLDAFRADLNSMTVHRRGSVQSLLGLGEHSGAEDYFARIHPDDAPTFQQSLRSATPEHPAYTISYRVRKPDGDYIWLSENAQVSFDQSGAAIRVTGICQDVTAEQTYRLQLEAREQQLTDALDRLELSLATSGAAAWSWDAEINMPVVNETMKRIFGFEANESPSFDDFATRFHELDRQRIIAANLGVMRDGGNYQEEYRIVLPSGDIRWLRAVGKAVHSADGKLENFFGVALDITDRKTQELEAIDREAHLRRVIDNTLNFVGVLDHNGILLEANQTAVAAAGLTRDDVIGKPFWECYWWAYDDKVSEQLRHAVWRAQDGEIVRYDATVRMANDTRMIIDFMLVAVRDDHDRITHLIPSGVDITERKRQEQQLAEALDRLDLALSVSGMAAWNWDVSVNQPIVSESLNRLYGFEPDAKPELQEFFARISAEDRGRVAMAVQQSMQGGGSYEEEYRVLLPSGATRWLRANGRSQLNADGKLQDFFGVIFDSTDRKLRELDLIDRETEVRHILDNQLNFCAILDNTGTLTEINAKAVQFSGLPREQFIGKKFWETDNWQFDADKPLQIKQDVERALSGEVVRYDTVVRFNGQLIDIDFLLAPVINADGKVTHVIPSGVDISQRKAAEHKLKAARMTAEAANRSKSEFLANMSHEIRTPMSAILGYADILAQHLRDVDNLNCVAIIRSNGEFLLEIINDILDISRIEAGKIEVVEKATRFDQLLSGVRSLMQMRAIEKSLHFSVELASEIPLTINTDPIRLRQILINLISNAIKFTNSGSVKLLVKYFAGDGSVGDSSVVDSSVDDSSAGADSAKIQFDIIDTGIGIAATLQEQVFEPFMQGENSVNRNFGGSGLGLTISRRLAKMLGGEITVASVAGKGSTFTLTIDAGHSSKGPFINQASLDQAPASVAADLAMIPRLTGRILVVDDRREIRFIAQHIIEDAGGTVVTADDGQAALDAIQRAGEEGNPFDVLVIDMQMPVLDGYETTRRLRAAGYAKPVIALTAHAMEGDRERCLQAGCTDYMVKPLDTIRFTQLLHRYLPKSPVACQAKPAISGPQQETKILLIDDSEQATEALAMLLEMRGCEVKSAADGEGGIALARSFLPDIVLLDLGLPDMTGFAVLKHLQTIPELAPAKFVATTGRDNSGETLAAGFHHHLLKPVDIDALMAWISCHD